MSENMIGVVRSRPEPEVEVIKPPKPVPPGDIDAYGYLQGIYQGRWQYEPERARAARDCLPFERPKLAVIAKVGESFAERLEEAIARRMAKPQVTNGSKLIEAKPIGSTKLRRL
jgi:hypothetical protein